MLIPAQYIIVHPHKYFMFTCSSIKYQFFISRINKIYIVYVHVPFIPFILSHVNRIFLLTYNFPMAPFFMSLDNTEYKKLNWKLPHEINLPENYFNRYKTNVPCLDYLFGGKIGGIKPMSSFTFAGEKGAGKTTFLLETLSFLANNNYNVAYISNEETIYSLVEKCRRLNINNVPLVDEKDIDAILFNLVSKKTTIAIIDSLPKLISSSDPKISDLEIVHKITSFTKNPEYNLTIGIVLHLTKDKKSKGDSSIEHDVDANFILRKGEYKIYNELDIREIESTKNRNGNTTTIALKMTEDGYDYISPIADGINTLIPQLTEEKELVKKDGRTENKTKRIIELTKMCQEKDLTMNELEVIFDVSCQTLMNDLTYMENMGLIHKVGKGENTKWKRN